MNPTLSPDLLALLQVLLISYGNLAAPPLSPAAKSFFTHSLTRMIFMTLIAYMVTHNPTVSVAAGIVVYLLTSMLAAPVEQASNLPLKTPSDKTRGEPMTVSGNLSLVKPIDVNTGIQEFQIMNVQDVSGKNKLKSPLTLYVRPKDYQTAISWSRNDVVKATGAYFADAHYLDYMKASSNGYLQLGKTVYK